MFTKIRNVFLILLVAFILFIIVVNVFITSMTWKTFSYPPGSSFSERDDWEYYAQLYVHSKAERKSKFAKKNIELVIRDKNKNILLNDNFIFDAALVDGKVNWDKFEEFNIEFFEYGHPGSLKSPNDAYNKSLIESGPNHLMTLTYKYDPILKRFRK